MPAAGKLRVFVMALGFGFKPSGLLASQPSRGLSASGEFTSPPEADEPLAGG